MRRPVAMLLFFLVATPAPGISQIAPGSAIDGSAALVKSYPEFLDRIEGNELLSKDGTRMRVPSFQRSSFPSIRSRNFG